MVEAGLIDAPPPAREPISNTARGGLNPWVPIYRIAPSGPGGIGATPGTYGNPSQLSSNNRQPTQPSNPAPLAAVAAKSTHKTPGLLSSRFANPVGDYNAKKNAAIALAELKKSRARLSSGTRQPSRPRGNTLSIPTASTPVSKLDDSGWSEDGSPITVEGSDTTQVKPPAQPPKNPTGYKISPEQEHIFQEANRRGQEAARAMQEHMHGSKSQGKETGEKDDKSDEEL